MKVCVCKLPSGVEPGSGVWRALAAAIGRERPDLLLLNEMPFGPWIASGEVPERAEIERCRWIHELGISALGELGTGVVLGTHATYHQGRNVNEAFIWTAGAAFSGCAE